MVEYVLIAVENTHMKLIAQQKKKTVAYAIRLIILQRFANQKIRITITRNEKKFII
jgi:hypothetical protein